MDLADAAKQQAAWPADQQDLHSEASGTMTVRVADTLTVTYANSTIIAQQRAIPEIQDGSSSFKYVLDGQSASSYRLQNALITGTTDSTRLTRKVSLMTVDDEHELMGGDNFIEINLADRPLTFTCDGRTATLNDLRITLRMTRLS